MNYGFSKRKAQTGDQYLTSSRVLSPTLHSVEEKTLTETTTKKLECVMS